MLRSAAKMRHRLNKVDSPGTGRLEASRLIEWRIACTAPRAPLYNTIESPYIPPAFPRRNTDLRSPKEHQASKQARKHASKQALHTTLLYEQHTAPPAHFNPRMHRHQDRLTRRFKQPAATARPPAPLDVQYSDYIPGHLPPSRHGKTRCQAPTTRP